MYPAKAGERAAIGSGYENGSGGCRLIFLADQRAEMKMTRILVADDEPVVLKMVVRSLAGKGFDQVDTVGNGQALVDAWSQGKHPLIISDIELPEKDGISACKEIRKRDANVTIIVMTGCPAAAERAEAAGFGPCLLKPFLPEDLIARLPKPT